MNKDFADFQRYFKEYQRKFGLTGYQVYFKYEPLEKAFARLVANQGEVVATVTLSSVLLDKDKPFKDIRRDAKHEALHLLINRLGANGRYRYSSEAEIYEAEEELVVKLEDLIP